MLSGRDSCCFLAVKTVSGCLQSVPEKQSCIETGLFDTSGYELSGRVRESRGNGDAVPVRKTAHAGNQDNAASLAASSSAVRASMISSRASPFSTFSIL